MAADAQLEEIIAANGLPVRRETPDADTLDLESRCRCLGDLPERTLEIAIVNAAPLRKLNEDLVLPPQTRFRFPQQRVDPKVRKRRQEIRFGHVRC
jgi:hypothetical protein